MRRQLTHPTRMRPSLMALAASWSGRVTTAVWVPAKAFRRDLTASRPSSVAPSRWVRRAPHISSFVVTSSRSLISIAVIGVREVAEPSSPIALSSLRPSSSGLVCKPCRVAAAVHPPALRRDFVDATDRVLQRRLRSQELQDLGVGFWVLRLDHHYSSARASSRLNLGLRIGGLGLCRDLGSRGAPASVPTEVSCNAENGVIGSWLHETRLASRRTRDAVGRVESKGRGSIGQEGTQAAQTTATGE
ncbi:unnamed protein product [Trichogramma brassicae]|uniref:Uncharacterized protein n=1 Tax=Trichogramma brassicae TaxID=86971 RepID=A0A6H5IQV6_9HYME|nr:unnamed protein product [Trichogramma brassicae]